AGVRRRQVRPPFREPDPRVHDPVRRRLDGRSTRPARDVVLRAVRALPAPQWRLGPGEGSLRRSLLRHSQRVRAELQTLGDRSAGALTARPRASFRTYRRDTLSGGDDRVPVFLPLSDSGLLTLPRPL